VFKNDRGLAYDDPFFVLRNEAKQEYFFGHLAWPANYRMEFHVSDGVTFKIGPKLRYALRVIRPAETILTPAVHLGRVQGDFDATVQEMHEHIRRSVLPPRGRDRSYLIQYLSNEDNPLTVYRGREYNEDTVKKCIDVAAAAGLEVCIVDGPTWCKAYGDWLVPDPQRFPRGFGPIVEYAHQKGLLFGLYAEPEGGREGYCGPGGGACIGNWDQSEVFIKHPNWFNQPGSILNLSIPEAAAYMDSELGQIIDHFHLDLYRHDFNAPLRNQGPYTLRDGYLENDYWRHYDALYDIFGRAHAGHPNVIWQQASGGGTRLELSTAGVFDENYTSDRVTFPYVYRMTSGLSVYLPPEILVTPNGMAGPNQPDLETILRSTYALGNTPMLFNGILPKSLNDFTQTQRQMFLRYANLYKKSIRPILPSCRVYHHAPVNAVGGVESGGWFAMEFTSPDRKRGWGIVIRLSNQVFGNYLFKPRGIDPAKNYDVWFDNERRRETFEGSRLVQEGLRIRLEARPASELILFEEK
jgi:alpha-galactosidase